MTDHFRGGTVPHVRALAGCTHAVLLLHATSEIIQKGRMTLAYDIMNKLRQKDGLSAMQIAVAIFGRRQPYYKKVHQECRRLVEAGDLERRGKGVQDDPFTYYLPTSA